MLINNVRCCFLLPLTCCLLLPLSDAARAEDGATAIKSLKSYLKQSASERPPLSDQEFLRVSLTRGDAELAASLLAADHKRRIRRERAREMRTLVLQVGQHKLPFFYATYGDAPPQGRSLFISLHGGGGTTQKANDRQWENQKRLYRPKEGVYVAPRAPTNTWNLWHQAHIDQLFSRLIENMVAFENVNPNRVYLLGYSAGGDGVYQLAPRMADRWAAAAMMAGHPNDASPLSLRNTAFAIHMGGKDSAYNRNGVAKQWRDKLHELQKSDPEAYTHLVKIYPNKGHWMDREDAAALPWMSKFTRQANPKKIVWQQDDVSHHRFYWLAVDADSLSGRAKVQAVVEGQTITIDSKGVTTLKIRLNDQILDLDQPITVRSGDRQLFKGKTERTIAMTHQTLVERGDPQAVYCSEVKVKLAEPGEERR